MNDNEMNTMTASSQYDVKKNKKSANPEMNANIFSRLLFYYYTSIMNLAQLRNLDKNDLYPLLPEDECNNVVDSFNKHWDNEVERCRLYNIDLRIKSSKEKPKNPNILRIIYNMSPYKFWVSGIMEFILRASMIGAPLILQVLVRFIQNEDKDDSYGIIFAILLFVITAIGGIAENKAYATLIRIGVHLQSCITGGVYRKSLKLSPKSRQRTNMGLIMNMVGQDTQRVFHLMQFVHIIWSAPLQFIVIMILLIDLIGIIPTIPPIVVLITSLILIQWVNDKIAIMEKDKMIIADHRVKMVNETLQGIKVVKLYAWEQSMSDRIAKLRQDEMTIVFRISLFRSCLFLSFLLTPMLMAVSTFYTMVAVDGAESITPVNVFGTVALINIIRMPLILFPTLMTNWAAAKISFKRIRKFFLLEEIDVLKSDDSIEVGTVLLDNAAFTWPLLREVKAQVAPPVVVNKDENLKSNSSKDNIMTDDNNDQATSASTENIELEKLNDNHKKKNITDDNNDKDDTNNNDKDDTNNNKKVISTGDHDFDFGFVLKNLTLHVKSGEIIEIIGKVGAGKTSFVRALIGDMEELNHDASKFLKRNEKSSMQFNGKIAYVPQQPWVRNVTFRENITFGNEYNKKKYEKILELCCLTHDREMLADGDFTEIGEKGINLSGGQKQRIALARAVYNDADIYLLDDTLSAVDPHVGKTIFYDCIVNYLKKRGKSIILCTHQVQFLEPADRIYIMDKGTFIETGTFEELKDHLVDFKQVAEDVNEEEKGLEQLPMSRTTSISETKSDTSELKREEAEKKKSLNSVNTAVPASVYKFYGHEAGGGLFVTFLGLLYIISQILLLASDWWLAMWTGDSFNKSNNYYMQFYGVLAAAASLAALLRIYVYSLGSQNASNSIHRDLLDHSMNASMSYYDTTPLGRVVDHFAKDMLFVDTYLPMMFDQYGTMFCTIFFSLIFIAVITFWFLIPLVIIFWVFKRIQTRFLNTARSIYRMWLDAHGPVFAFLGESFMGVSSIRAYQREDEYIEYMDDRINTVNNAALHSQMLTRWLDVRLDLVSSVLIGAAAILIVLVKDDLSAELAALSLTLVVNLTGLIGLFVLIGSFLDTFMTAVQRIHSMWDVPTENYEGKKEAPANWPKNGHIEFKDVSLCYNEDGPMILKNLNVSIPAGAKVGICGRTGAGKTTLTTALFRIVELARGQISIDGQNLRELSLTEFRSKMAIIPQDAVCFEGNVRFNLDPFHQCTDDELWKVLERVHLREKIHSNSDGLMAKVEPNGANFSMGERQLFCMARALLRKPNVLVMDEATASIDQRTDTLIQEMIRQEFSNATVLTIAHRLNTIADSDYILCLDDGEVAEFDSPENLLKKDHGHYKAMVGEAMTTDEQNQLKADEQNQ